jgi:starch synthase
MAAARAIVASRVSAIPEIVEHGATGLLVPPDDEPALAGALVALLAEPEEAARMGARGRERLEREFSLAAMMSATEKLYRETLATAAHRSGAERPNGRVR